MPLTDLRECSAPVRSERQAAKADKHSRQSSNVAKPPKRARKPLLEDDETFIAPLGTARDEGDLDKNPPKTAASAPTPTIPSPSLFPTPTPPSTLKIEEMNRHSRNFKPVTDSPTLLRVQRTHNGTPHPYPRTVRYTPPYKPGDKMLDPIDIAVATATAAATPNVAKEIRLAVAAIAKTAHERMRLVTEIERNPAKIYCYIGMSDILKRIVKDAAYEATRTTRNRPASAKSEAPKSAKGQALGELQPKITPELTNVICDLITISQINNVILTSQFQTLASSNAPTDLRIHPEICGHTKEHHEANEFDSDGIIASMNDDTDMTNTEDLPGSTNIRDD